MTANSSKVNIMGRVIRIQNPNLVPARDVKRELLHLIANPLLIHVAIMVFFEHAMVDNRLPDQRVCLATIGVMHEAPNKALERGSQLAGISGRIQAEPLQCTQAHPWCRRDPRRELPDSETRTKLSRPRPLPTDHRARVSNTHGATGTADPQNFRRPLLALLPQLLPVLTYPLQGPFPSFPVAPKFPMRGSSFEQYLRNSTYFHGLRR